MALPPGVPNLLRLPAQYAGAANLLNTAVLLRSDATLLLRLFQRSRWGIYLNGAQVITPDNVVSVEYRQDTRVSDHPLEDGDFETYNKVGTPYEATVRMTKGGSEADRKAFLASAEAIVNSFDLYDVVTPEKTYSRANVQSYDYQRSSTNGAGLITIDFHLIEVRAFAKARLVNAKTPAGADPVSGGRVQPQTPSKAITNFVGRVPAPAITNFVGLVPNPR